MATVDRPHIARVWRLLRSVSRKGKSTNDVAYAVIILSRHKARPERLVTLSRGHWGIEDRTRWVGYVTFDEDRSQIRTGAAPRVMAAPRNMATSLLRLARGPNVTEALRRNTAGADEALALVGARSGQPKGSGLIVPALTFHPGGDSLPGYSTMRLRAESQPRRAER